MLTFTKENRAVGLLAVRHGFSVICGAGHPDATYGNAVAAIDVQTVSFISQETFHRHSP
ncbi:MAG: hypothetical protein SPD11_00220 [Sphaerochaetaceae bacterium]|nr:hypothetical protein [Sphaerochaetaceae bacterium]